MQDPKSDAAWQLRRNHAESHMGKRLKSAKGLDHSVFQHFWQGRSRLCEKGDYPVPDLLELRKMPIWITHTWWGCDAELVFEPNTKQLHPRSKPAAD